MSSLHNQLTKAVADYKMPDEAKRLVADSQLLALCGVTAAGKNTIMDYLTEHDHFVRMVSHTTREPRVNEGVPEQNGRDYWFVDEAKMLELVQEQAFVEVKKIHERQFSGTSIMTIQQAVQSDMRPVNEIDVQGAVEFMSELSSLRPLFVLPPSYEIWLERFSNRGVLNDEERERRFISARKELQAAIDEPQFALIVNHEFHETVAEIMRGIDLSDKAQAERRQLANDLLRAISS